LISEYELGFIIDATGTLRSLVATRRCGRFFRCWIYLQKYFLNAIVASQGITILRSMTNTITTPIGTYPIVKRLPLEGHVYAFRRLKIGWINSGMVDENEKKRTEYASYLMAGRPWSSDHSLNMLQLIEKGQPQDEKATAVAFMPFCIADTNYMSQELIDTEAIEVI
jgi:hypothetical protein